MPCITMMNKCGDEMVKAGPRVYVPIALPDSNVQTYAVLEFLGFSSSSPSPSYPLPSFINSSSSVIPGSSTDSFPLMIKSVNSIASTHPAANLPFGLSSVDAPVNFSVTHHIGTDTLPQVPQGLHLVWPGASPESFRGETPPLSPTGIGRKGPTEGNHKDIRDTKDRKLVPIKASSMKKAGGAAVTPLSPGGKKPLPSLGVTTGVSVSQTERETIVHTNSSNFREIVHQLTGASSEDQDLLPVTLPARYLNRIDSIGGKQDVAVSKVEIGGMKTIGDLGPRKATTKLHERRKAMRNLEKLTTTSKELPPLVPSPVTPLASDFEKFCLPSTPTTSQGSSGVSPRDELKIVGERRVISERQAIAEKGFYLHSERPRNAGPTLLNLFPESPACSPRGT